VSATRPVVGVDIGGSGIKAALVDTELGALVGERVRVPTPQPAIPAAIISVVSRLVSGLAASGPVGIGLPAPIVKGVATMAANIDPTWVGVMAEQEIATALGRPCAVLNDADAAGLAEVRFGAGRDVPGVVLVLTLGTGIGSALFIDGRLVPNTELGHIEIRGKDGERRASAGARERRGLSYREWAPLLEEFIRRVDRLIWPDLVILGGGVSKKADRFVPLLDVRPPVVAASLQNEAGIVGAALRAAELADVIPRPEGDQSPRIGASR
jgi:polyphosphate glucokinase